MHDAAATGGESRYMIHADRELAHRLEALICEEFRRLAGVGRRVFPTAGVECLDVAGGVALWLGDGSPVNQAVGLGMCDPVADTELALLEAFYHERGADASISICPLAHPAVFAALGRRGWSVTGFEHVLVLGVGDKWATGPRSDVARSAGVGAEVEVRVCTREEREAWAGLAARGFADGQAVEPAHQEFGRVMAARQEAILVLGWVEGGPAGTGALVIDDGVGWLSGDSTLPEFRRRGVQQAIQQARLELAREAGCDLAVTEAEPGGGSQRNMERLGFRIVYTHVEFVKAVPPDGPGTRRKATQEAAAASAR